MSSFTRRVLRTSFVFTLVAAATMRLLEQYGVTVDEQATIIYELGEVVIRAVSTIMKDVFSPAEDWSKRVLFAEHQELNAPIWRLIQSLCFDILFWLVMMVRLWYGVFAIAYAIAMQGLNYFTDETHWITGRDLGRLISRLAWS